MLWRPVSAVRKTRCGSRNTFLDPGKVITPRLKEWRTAELYPLPDAAAQWARLEELRTWEHPGPGSFYDDLGHLGRSPRVAWELGAPRWSGGFAWWEEGHTRTRLSWQVTSWLRNGLQYGHLDPNAAYVLRFSGFGDMKVLADKQTLEPSPYGVENGDIKEYPVPQDLLQDGSLTVTFQPQRLPGVNWRYQPRRAEAWLVKK